MFTDAAKNIIINELTGQTTSGFDYSAMKLGLFSGTSPDFVELTAGAAPGYSRVLIGDPGYSSMNCFGTAVSGSVTNIKDIQFGRATGAWPTVTAAGIFTSGGLQLTIDPLVSALSGIDNNWVVIIPSNNCTISFI